MVKKILKWVLIIFLGLILLIALSYGGFHLWEYMSGKKYLKYLTENSETVPIEKSFDFEILEKDIESKKLILVGEIHGFDEPAKFDVDFFKYLHEDHNVKHYLAELDFVQANLLNVFLETGNRGLLSNVLENWVVAQGRNNIDYLNKYLELQKYYQQLPANKKFRFIGIDKIQDRSLLVDFLMTISPNDSLDSLDASDNETIVEQIEKLSGIYSEMPDTLFILSHLKNNMGYIQERRNREEVMFQNFSNLYKEYGLEEHRLYGFFGLYHVFQYRVNGKHPLASKIRQSDLNLEDKILSINFMMNDSYMVMPSKQLPEFMRDESPYTKMPVSADNMLVMYIIGIKDFKRLTPEYHKSLIKMNNKGNPYSNSVRLNKTIQLLPVTDVFEMTDKGKQYVQYTIFVRNSDWAEPMEKQ